MQAFVGISSSTAPPHAGHVMTERKVTSMLIPMMSRVVLVLMPASCHPSEEGGNAR